MVTPTDNEHPPDSTAADERPTLLQSLAIYLDPRILLLGGLGFASGLPRLLVYSTLTFWLIAEGMEIEAVGLFAATALPYNFKFVWAPVLDRLRLPVLQPLLGTRRSWIVVLQFLLAVAIVAMSLTDPGEAPLVTAVAALVVAFLSASQDIVIDAYRVDLLEDDEQGAGAAMAVYGYRVGMLVAGAGALYLVAFIDSWSLVYAIMAVAMLLCIVPTLLAPRTPAEAVRDPVPSASADVDDDASLSTRLAAWFRDAVLGPFRAFATRRLWGAILVFVLLFKLGDALAGTMTNPFLEAMGFEEITIANIGKTYGLVATIVGVGLGGLIVKRLGVVSALWVTGALQVVSNLAFVIQARLGDDTAFLAVTIGFENLTGGLGTAAFVAFLSGLCDKRYSATQYALLTAVSSSLQTVLSTGTGFLVASVGWATFYGFTALAGAPGLLVLYLISRRGGVQLTPQNPE